MSLTIRCPACETKFKLLPDRLLASGGWARCGQCHEIFNFNEPRSDQDRGAWGADSVDGAARQRPADFAIEQVPVLGRHHALDAGSTQEAASAGMSPPRSILSTIVGNLPDLELPDLGSHQPARDSVDMTPGPTIDIDSGRRAPDGDEVIATPILRPSLPDDEHAATDFSTGSNAGKPREATRQDVAARHAKRDVHRNGASGVARSAASAPVAATGGDESQDLESLSFMRGARPSQVPAPPSPRWPARVGVVALATALTVQIALHQRDRLAASAPALGPVLGLICRPFGCEVGPMRRIESLVIDSSSLNKAGEAGYVLQLTIRNQADIELVTPGIELTLTDMQDRPVVRRVLLPPEFDGSASLSAGGEGAGAVSFTVSAEVAPIAGYRVIAFYP